MATVSLDESQRAQLAEYNRTGNYAEGYRYVADIVDSSGGDSRTSNWLRKLRTSQRRAADWRPNRFLARSSATDFTRNPAFDRVSAFYRRTSPVSASNSRRAIHRFDRANKVTSCAVFLARPRKRTLV